MTISPSKLQLGAAVQAFHAIIDLVDEFEENGNHHSNDLEYKFHFLKDVFQNEVEDRVNLLRYLKAEVERLKGLKAAVNFRIENMEKAFKIMERETILHIKANPDMDFVGYSGKLSIRRNGGPLPIKWNPTLKFTDIKRVIPFPQKYPQEYLEKHEIYVLRPEFEDAVRQGSLNTEVCEVQPRGEHLNIGV